MKKPKKKLELETVATFGKWNVLENGTITGEYTNSDTLEVRKNLCIYPDRLAETDFFLAFLADSFPVHEWGNLIQAWFEACALAGVEQITIKTLYN